MSRRAESKCLGMNDNYISKHTSKLIFVLGALLFAYTSYRAAVLSITWDEAFSYLQFVRHEIFLPEKYEQMHANNHFLNTWLNIFFVKGFGVSELVLRLPSLIAHVLFLLLEPLLGTSNKTLNTKRYSIWMQNLLT